MAQIEGGGQLLCMPRSTGETGLCLQGTNEEPASPPPLHTGQQVNEELEHLTTQLQLMTRERDELRNRLASVTTEWALKSRLNTDLTRMKMELIWVMSDLRKMKIQYSKGSEKIKMEERDTRFLRDLHSRLLSEKIQLKDDVHSLWEKNRQLLEGQKQLQRCLEDMKMCSEGDQKMGNVRIQQQQENDREARLQLLLGPEEQLTKQRDLAARVQHQFTILEKRFEKLKQELDQAKAQKKALLLEMNKPKLEN